MECILSSRRIAPPLPVRNSTPLLSANSFVCVRFAFSAIFPFQMKNCRRLLRQGLPREKIEGFGKGVEKNSFSEAPRKVDIGQPRINILRWTPLAASKRIKKSVKGLFLFCSIGEKL
ncbi:hypothetical protein TNCT_282871 [Trichonephila clavata]|uniref:Uncharacterized protein n=1 Tax=Trichonephila clavata TaxID=2740835 RepID=A0A8X6K555_TRICU|nr:hypothetical protein TNCT_282871 [Trichonephila clavata]